MSNSVIYPLLILRLSALSSSTCPVENVEELRVATGGLIAAFLVWLLGIRRIRRRQVWKKIILWIIFAILSVGSILIFLVKYFITNRMGT